MEFAVIEHTGSAPLEPAFSYEHTDIPPGLTLADWRRARPRPDRRTLRALLRSVLLQS